MIFFKHNGLSFYKLLFFTKYEEKKKQKNQEYCSFLSNKIYLECLQFHLKNQRHLTSAWILWNNVNLNIGVGITFHVIYRMPLNCFIYKYTLKAIFQWKIIYNICWQTNFNYILRYCIISYLIKILPRLRSRHDCVTTLTFAIDQGNTISLMF